MIATANFKDIYVEKDSTLSHYPDYQEHCEVFSTVIRGLPFDQFTGQSKVMTKVWNTDVVTTSKDWTTNPHKGLLLKFDPKNVLKTSNKGTNKIDLNNLFARTDDNLANAYPEDDQTDSNTKRPGIIVILKTPEKGDQCVDTVTKNDINGWFYYHSEDQYADEVRLISQETAAILGNAADKTKFDPATA